MNIKILKLKNSIMKKSTIILSILFILCLISSVWGYLSYPEPTYKDESYISSHYTQFGEYNYYALVTESNPIYAESTILNDEYPAYFYTISPNANVNFSYGIEASDSAEMDVDIETKIILYAKSKNKDENSFWTKEYSVKRNDFKLENNQVYYYHYMLYAQDIQELIEEVKKHLKYSQSASVKIITSITSEGVINDNNVTTYEEYILPITIESSYYQFPKETKVEETTNSYSSREITIEPKTKDKIIPFILPLLFLVMIVGLFVYCKYFFIETSQETINQLEVKQEHINMSDWISEGKLPLKFELIPSIKINSLTDLINLSIDTNTRVIYDIEKNIYFSISNNIMYLYSTEEPLA